MPHDLFITSGRGLETDQTNDLRTVDGDDAILQFIAMGAARRTDPFRGEELTTNDIERFRSAIEDAVRDNYFTTPPVNVRITERTETSINIEITTAARSLSLTAQ